MIFLDTFQARGKRKLRLFHKVMTPNLTDIMMLKGLKGWYLLETDRFPIKISAWQSKLNDVELHIIGAPLNDNEVHLLTEYLPGRFVSHVYPESSEVSRLYNSSAALLYLSEYEGFGLPLLEAMASGCPVIAQNKSSIPEVAGDSCILLDKVSPSIIAHHIESLCSFDYDFNALVESGLNRVRNYSWDQTAESTFAFYKSLLN